MSEAARTFSGLSGSNFVSRGPRTELCIPQLPGRVKLPGKEQSSLHYTRS